MIDGLEADVVTLALAYDIDAIAETRPAAEGLAEAPAATTARPTPRRSCSWCARATRRASRTGTTSSSRASRSSRPNPKTSGGARWNYLAAWGYALKQPGGNDAKAKEFVTALFKNVPVLDSGARGSTTTFVQRGIGDVLLAWENEAFLAIKELGPDKVEIVVPSLSILAEPPVAVVDKVVDKKGTRAVAQAYLEYLYTPEGQEIAAKQLLPAAARGRGEEVRRAASRRSSCSRSTKSSAAGRRRRRRTSPTAASSTRSTSPGSDGSTSGDACRQRTAQTSAMLGPSNGVPHRRGSVLPGFGLTLGFTLLYLALVVLIPLSTLFWKSASLGAGGLLAGRHARRASSPRTS